MMTVLQIQYLLVYIDRLVAFILLFIWAQNSFYTKFMNKMELFLFLIGMPKPQILTKLNLHHVHNRIFLVLRIVVCSLFEGHRANNVLLLALELKRQAVFIFDKVCKLLLLLILLRIQDLFFSSMNNHSDNLNLYDYEISSKKLQNMHLTFFILRQL